MLMRNTDIYADYYSVGCAKFKIKPQSISQPLACISQLITGTSGVHDDEILFDR